MKQVYGGKKEGRQDDQPKKNCDVSWSCLEGAKVKSADDDQASQYGGNFYKYRHALDLTCDGNASRVVRAYYCVSQNSKTKLKKAM